MTIRAFRGHFTRRAPPRRRAGRHLLALRRRHVDRRLHDGLHPLGEVKNRNVRNPLRSEADAFRFLLLTIGYFALIVIGAVINTWLGLAVFVVLTLVVLYVAFIRGRDEPPPRVAPTLSHPDDERRILVDRERDGRRRHAARDDQAEERGLSRRTCSSSRRRSRRRCSTSRPTTMPRGSAAQERLDASLAKLREAGISARGQIGDADPVQAIEDALRTFGPDEMIISTHPEGRSHWLERGVVEHARERFAVPITHVVVDLRRAAQRGSLAADEVSRARPRASPASPARASRRRSSPRASSSAARPMRAGAAASTLPRR